MGQHIDPALMTVIITAGAGLLTGLAQLCVALAAYFKSKANSAALAENTALTKETHEATNSTITKLVEVVGEKAAAEATGNHPLIQPPETKS